jgi:hypothetical protein
MMLKAKAAYGDDDDSPSHTGLCSDFYVFKWVLTRPEWCSFPDYMRFRVKACVETVLKLDPPSGRNRGDSR